LQTKTHQNDEVGNQQRRKRCQFVPHISISLKKQILIKFD